MSAMFKNWVMNTQNVARATSSVLDLGRVRGVEYNTVKSITLFITIVNTVEPMGA